MEHPDSENPEAGWYYTTSDDQAGPVTFEELKAKAASGELHPRSDLAWRDGMDEWKPAGEIDGLFERKESDSAEGNTKTPGLKSLAELEATKQPFGEVDLWPGATRRWYLLLVYVFPILWIALALAFAQFAGPKLAPSFQLLFLLIGVIVPVWVMIDTTLSRLSNVGMSKWWFFGNFVPILNFWVGFRIFACPAGYAKTRNLDPPGWLLAIFYWVMVLGSTVSAVLAPASINNLMNDPEIRKYIEDFQAKAEQAKEIKEKASKTTGDMHEEREKERERKKKEKKPAP